MRRRMRRADAETSRCLRTQCFTWSLDLTPSWFLSYYLKMQDFFKLLIWNTLARPPNRAPKISNLKSQGSATGWGQWTHHDKLLAKAGPVLSWVKGLHWTLKRLERIVTHRGLLQPPTIHLLYYGNVRGFEGEVNTFGTLWPFLIDIYQPVIINCSLTSTLHRDVTDHPLLCCLAPWVRKPL